MRCNIPWDRVVGRNRFIAPFEGQLSLVLAGWSVVA
jgi:hypothetical protein